jgi:hypothetical protein
MKEREPAVVGGLIILLLVLWLGFAVHASPRFPGSVWGGALGVCGAVLMVWPLGYSAAKRIAPLKNWITKRVSMSTLLGWHVYTGIVGAILAILHSSHKFDSTVGIFLTGAMLVAVLTGFIGRYFMKLVSRELRERRDMLTKLQTSYQQTATELSAHPEEVAYAQAHTRLWQRLTGALFVSEAAAGTAGLALSSRAFQLAESMADVEYAIKTDELLKRRFAIWLNLHIVASIIFYVLLSVHVWSSIYFGLRWFG